MSRRIARRLVAWATSLNGGRCPCDNCRELGTYIGSGASRAERRRAHRAGWRYGGKGK